MNEDDRKADAFRKKQQKNPIPAWEAGMGFSFS